MSKERVLYTHPFESRYLNKEKIMSGLSKHKSIYNPNKLSCSDMVGSNLLDGYGLQLTSTTVGLNQALDVFVEGFNPSLINEDGYLIVDFSNDLLGPDGYLQVNVINQPNLYAEDSVHVSGDIGSFVLAVRNDNNIVLTSDDGDYSPFAVDAYGRMKVLADFDPSMLNEDGYLNVNLAGPIVVNVDINAEYAEDSVHTSGDIGDFVLAVRNDNNIALTSADGDYSPFAVDAYGKMKISPSAIVVDCPLPVAGADGDRLDLGLDTYRRLYVNDSAHVGMLVTQNTINMTSELALATGMPGRTRIFIQNVSDCPIYVGHDSSVSTSNGFYVGGGNTFVAEAGECISFYVIAEEAGTDIRIMELG